MKNETSVQRPPSNFKAPASLTDGLPAWSRRQTGYVTQRLIDQHGSYAAAKAWLNANSEN